jgi:GDPmannose 4,6-dehydratase
VAEIKLGLAKELKLGNLEAKRDWGYSGDYVKAMWLMLQQEKPDDYVIATGKTHSVKEFAELAFGHVGLNYQEYLKTDEVFYRPAEVQLLKGDYSKGKKILGWDPKVSFKDLVQMMVDTDLKSLNHKIDR